VFEFAHSLKDPPQSWLAPYLFIFNLC